MRISSNIFYNNNAYIGGVVYILKLFPDNNFQSSNIFSKNTALYGNNFASYPSRLIVANKKYLKNFAINCYSGIKIESFALNIIDHFGQIIETNHGM